MPGTPEQYMDSPDFDQAADIIDDLIDSGEATGDSVLSALMDSGLRVYPEESAEEGAEGDLLEEDPLEEEMPEEMPEEMTEDDAGGPMAEGPGGMGGMGGPGGVLIEAARFGMDKDKEKKAKRQKDLEEYA